MTNSDVIARASIAVSVSAFFSGALIAIVAVSIFVWVPLEPQAKKCLETAKFTQTINTTTTSFSGVTTTTQREEAVGQCGGQKEQTCPQIQLVNGKPKVPEKNVLPARTARLWHQGTGLANPARTRPHSLHVRLGDGSSLHDNLKNGFGHNGSGVGCSL